MASLLQLTLACAVLATGVTVCFQVRSVPDIPVQCQCLCELSAALRFSHLTVAITRDAVLAVLYSAEARF